MRISTKKMKLIMAKRGMNATDLIRTAGIDRVTYYKIVNGTSQTSRPKTIYRIAKALFVRVEDILED